MVQYFTEIVKKYSIAIFEFAVQNKIVEKIHNDFSNISSVFLEDPSLLKNIAASIYSDAQRNEILNAVLDRLSGSKEVTNYVLFLAKNNRLEYLLDIIKYYNLLYKAFKGEKDIEVTSSYELSKEEVEVLSKELATVFLAKVNLILKENPEIFGGLVIKEGNTMYDGSLKTKFEAIKESAKEEIVLL